MHLMGFAFIAAGVFTIVAGAFNWDWFMNYRKARFICSICGRGGARIFYIVLGTAFVVLGTLVATGVIQDSQ